MSYSDFSLKKVKDEFQLTLIETDDLFLDVPDIQISDFLLKILDYNIPLALAIGTEKARSELIIVNILLEIRKLLSNQISLFSGVNLDVDKEKGLAGFCDFVISKSQEQLYLTAPIITIVEAKNECISGGLGQCIAEMYASNIFNIKEDSQFSVVYGVVTTGTNWKFLKLENDKVYIDLREYYISNINKIIAIFLEMIDK
ncbi:MAG: hypothetical protein WAX77_10135 [Methylococcaceae bacterium]